MIVDEIEPYPRNQHTRAALTVAGPKASRLITPYHGNFSSRAARRSDDLAPPCNKSRNSARTRPRSILVVRVLRRTAPRRASEVSRRNGAMFRNDSRILLCLGVVVAGLLAQACEKKCPTGSTLQGQQCIASGGAQGVAQAPAAGAAATAPTETGATEATEPSAASSAGRNAKKPVATAAAGSSAAPTTPPRMAMAATAADAGSALPAEPAAPAAACDEAEVRCNPTTAGVVETCEAGQWVPQDCAAGEQCIDAADGPKCVLPVEACAGRDGQSICTDTGEMLACMEGGGAMTVAMCSDSTLCKAGLTSGACANCVPGTFQCTGTQLQSCDPEGQAFGVQEQCASAALCDKMAGQCKAPACEAGEFKCTGDNLTRCNKDQTAFEMSKRCMPGLCDEQAQTCRMCMAGTARCSGSARQECDDSGQKFVAAACPDATPFCIGDGQCTECRLQNDCKPRACHVAACGLGKCSYTPDAKRASRCGYGNGTKIRYTMDGEGGKIYVVAGGAKFHIRTAEELDAYFGGANGVTEVSSSALAACGTDPDVGTNLQEVTDPAIGHIGTDRAWHHIVHAEDLDANCGGYATVAKIPGGGLSANGISRGSDI